MGSKQGFGYNTCYYFEHGGGTNTCYAVIPEWRERVQTFADQHAFVHFHFTTQAATWWEASDEMIDFINLHVKKTTSRKKLTKS